MLETLILSIVVALIATTISESQLFRGFRLWAKEQGHLFGVLFGCGYCVSHWVALVLVAIYRPRILHSNLEILDFILTACFIGWLSILQCASLITILKLDGRELSEK